MATKALIKIIIIIVSGSKLYFPLVVCFSKYKLADPYQISLIQFCVHEVNPCSSVKYMIVFMIVPHNIKIS